MEFTILEEDKDSIKIRFENEDATFANALKDEIWNDKNVDAATVTKKHPLVSKPELIVQGKDVKKILKTAAENLKKNVEDFDKQVQKL